MKAFVWLIVILALVMLAVAFLAPDEATGKLFGADNISDAFTLNGFKERLARMTPGYVFTVTADTTSRAVGAVLGEASTALGPVVDVARRPQESAEEALSSARGTLVPQTKEEKRKEVIEALELRIAELEARDSLSRDEVLSLTKELAELVDELNRVKEDGGIVDAVIEGAKKTLAPGRTEPACECGALQ